MENFINELKLKVNELNELINEFEITKLKNNANGEIDFSHLTDEQLEEIHQNYDILDIYSEDELFGAAADNARDPEDVFDLCIIEDYVKDNFSLSDFYTDDEIIDYVKGNLYLDDVFSDDEMIEYLTSNYSLSDLADWR